VDAVLADLLLRDRLEEDPEPGAVRRHEADLTGVVNVPAQRCGPEARQPDRIVRIEGEADEL
jgi:hypothetical protein